MTHSFTSTVGMVLLCGAALLAHSQNQTPAKPAPNAPAAAVQPISQSLGLIVYPAKEQSASRQSIDEQECYNWAKLQTNIDPLAPAPAAAAPEKSKPSGQRVRSAARGAAAGAIIGEVADNDADEGAKIGAAAGALAGGRQAREEKNAHEQQAKNEAQASQAERQATFKKAVGTCLQGRGYTAG